MTSTATLVKQHLVASKKAMKSALRSKRSARTFLVRAGILAKNGKQRAKPYR